MSWIYFIRAEDTLKVKIGFAKDVGKRMESLQSGNPGELSLIAKTTATLGEEKELHDILKRERPDLHVRGEWYHPALDLFGLMIWIIKTRRSRNLPGYIFSNWRTHEKRASITTPWTLCTIRASDVPAKRRHVHK